jgi:hypothetical protein
MGIYPTTWAAPLFVEAMKFWFFSLLLSMSISLLQLQSLQSSPVLEKPGEKQLKRKGLSQIERKARRRALLKKLATDMSTVLSWSDVWIKIQGT